MKRSPLTLFLLVFAIALVVRVANLDSFPPGLWMDEGLNGVDAWYSLHSDARRAADLKMVYPDIFPREPLLVWILSITLAIGGPKVIMMRLTTVLIGSLACVAFFGMVARTDRRRGIGFALTAAFVLATLHWHAHFSRLIFRTNLIPLIACAAIWAIASASQHRRRWRWLLAGAVVGVGFYAYLAWYFFLPVVALWIWALAKKEQTTPEADANVRASILRSLPAFALGVALVATPLMLHYLTAPSDLTGRAEAVSPLKNGLADGARLITANIRDVLLMFSFRGDHVPIHNVTTALPQGHPDYGKTGTPVLDIVWSLFLYAGLLRMLVGLWRGGAERRRNAAWLAWLVCMSLPSILSQTDSANTLRNLGATPALAYCIASGWWWAFEAATARAADSRRRIVRTLLIALLMWGAGFQVYKSWVRHPHQPGIQSAFSVLHVELARLCEPDPARAPLYVPTDFYRHKTFEFLTIGREDIQPLDFAEALAQPATGPVADHRIVCTALSPGNTNALRQAFPGATLEPNPIQLYPPGGGEPRPYAWIIRIPGEALLPRSEAENKARTLRLIRER